RRNLVLAGLESADDGEPVLRARNEGRFRLGGAVVGALAVYAELPSPDRCEVDRERRLLLQVSGGFRVLGTDVPLEVLEFERRVLGISPEQFDQRDRTETASRSAHLRFPTRAPRDG